jgi:putative membrane protein insertion efficiency factor
MGQIMRKMICFPIKLYQYLLSPLMKPCCRFYPSCSDYALSAVEHYGIGKGLWLACCRLLRCHPWADGGYDPILPKKENS